MLRDLNDLRRQRVLRFGTPNAKIRVGEPLQRNEPPHHQRVLHRGQGQRPNEERVACDLDTEGPAQTVPQGHQFRHVGPRRQIKAGLILLGAQHPRADQPLNPRQRHTHRDMGLLTTLHLVGDSLRDTLRPILGKRSGGGAPPPGTRFYLRCPIQWCLPTTCTETAWAKAHPTAIEIFSPP